MTPTAKQISYIAILFDDLGFNSIRRKEFLHYRFKKHFPDELTIGQIGAAIDELKKMKEDLNDYSNRIE